jgi:hypothetical protein
MFNPHFLAEEEIARKGYGDQSHQGCREPDVKPFGSATPLSGVEIIH